MLSLKIKTHRALHLAHHNFSLSLISGYRVAEYDKLENISLTSINSVATRGGFKTLYWRAMCMWAMRVSSIINMTSRTLCLVAKPSMVATGVIILVASYPGSPVWRGYYIGQNNRRIF